ncbi:MAG: KilA-N domain-containing protein [Hyphomicrobiaceae bacterium]
MRSEAVRGILDRTRGSIQNSEPGTNVSMAGDRCRFDRLGERVGASKRFSFAYSHPTIKRQSVALHRSEDRMTHYLQLIPHTIEGEVVNQRVKDGYINATAMCKAANKLWADYYRLKTSEEFFAALEADMGIPISEQIQSVKGGFPELQGTWVHPHVAINLAQWLSPRFAVQVAKWVYEWMARGEPSIRGFERLIRVYLAKGRPEEWIRERIEGILTRRELTDEWHDRGIGKPDRYAALTRILQVLSVGMGPKEHRAFKGLEPHHSLRDHSTELELLFTRLGERSTIEIARAKNAQGYGQNKTVAAAGGEIAKTARLKLEELTGRPVASPRNFLPKAMSTAIVAPPAADPPTGSG